MSLLRRSEYTALSTLLLEGDVVDLGGERRSKYGELFKGSPKITTVNLASAEPDVVADLEKELPLASGTYNTALLINVLEHIFEYRALLRETRRVVVVGGRVVIVVPFMFPCHPSPHDYHRFTAEALRREVEGAGFTDIKITALGSGVFAMRYQALERLLPGSVQMMLAPLFYRVVALCDWLFLRVARVLRKKYMPEDYALGFCVVGQAAP